jgi:excisionase family DNA binding protein
MLAPDKLLASMDGSPEQLSLLLFESHSEQHRPPQPRRRTRERKPNPAVAASRTVSQPDATHAEPPITEAPTAALLTTDEAAAMLHVHRRTIQRLVERGQLEAIHLGAAVRFDPRDVADLTTRLKRPVPQAAAASAAVLRPGRAVRVSFADRLKSPHEHRAAHA